MVSGGMEFASGASAFEREREAPLQFRYSKFVLSLLCYNIMVGRDYQVRRSVTEMYQAFHFQCVFEHVALWPE